MGWEEGKIDLMTSWFMTFSFHFIYFISPFA
jgi:hypothetical protein